jgi:hypothetical protein
MRQPKLTMRLAVAVFLVAAVAHAAPPVPFFGHAERPLLYFISAVSPDGGLHWSKAQVYIFRSGTVLFARLSEQEGTDLPLGSTLFSGKAAPDRMAALRRALTAIQVGQQTDCFLDPPDAPFDWSYRFTWFGNGDRRNTFVLKDSSPPPHCPDEMYELVDAAEAVYRSASDAATTKLQTP